MHRRAARELRGRRASGDFDVEVKDEKIDGDKATVDVESSGSFGGEDIAETITFSLVKEDGDWKIDSIG